MNHGPAHFVDEATDFLILKSLDSEEMHSLGISNRIDEISNGAFRVELRSLIATLHRMEAAGWLTSGWAQRGGRRSAKYYWLTQPGRRQLEIQTKRLARVPLSEVVAGAASHAGLKKDNSRLSVSLAQEAAERERMNREMELVRQVQEILLPRVAPDLPGVECSGFCRPAFAVGGDYYDFLPLSDGRIAFAIGDISGKGLAAALLMASLQAFLRAATFDPPDDLPLLMRRLNKLLLGVTGADRYATLFYAQYDPATQRLNWVNAGHNPPLLFHGSEFRSLDEGGPVVGLLSDPEYQEGSTQLAHDDLLVAYTDGVTEAVNLKEEEWGECRLRAAVAQHRGENISVPAQLLLERILEFADAHSANAPQRDDMTLIALRPAPKL